MGNQNGHSRETGNIRYTRQTKTKQKHKIYELKSLFNEDGYRPYRSADRGIYCSLSRFHPSGILVHVPLKS
jgi:hypothetical protein